MAEVSATQETTTVPKTMGDILAAKYPVQEDASKSKETVETVDEKKVDDKTSEPENKEPKEVAKPTAEQKPAPETPSDWRKSIAKEKHEDVLKELGYDDDFIKMAGFRKTNGDLKPYFDAHKNDFSTMQPEEILRLKTFAEKGLTDEEKAILYEAEMGKYKLDPELYSPEEIAAAKVMLKRDTNPIREQFEADRQKFLIPPADPMAKLQADAEAALLKEQETDRAYNDKIVSNDLAKSIIEKKTLTIGKGKDAFNMEVSDPESVLGMLTGKTDWGKHWNNEDGSPNVENQLMTMKFLSDIKGYNKSLIEHGKSLEKAAQLAEQENLQPFGTQKTTVGEELSPARLLAKHGQMKSR